MGSFDIKTSPFKAISLHTPYFDIILKYILIIYFNNKLDDKI